MVSTMIKLTLNTSKTFQMTSMLKRLQQKWVKSPWLKREMLSAIGNHRGDCRPSALNSLKRCPTLREVMLLANLLAIQGQFIASPAQPGAFKVQCRRGQIWENLARCKCSKCNKMQLISLISLITTNLRCGMHSIPTSHACFSQVLRGGSSVAWSACKPCSMHTKQAWAWQKSCTNSKVVNVAFVVKNSPSFLRTDAANFTNEH